MHKEGKRSDTMYILERPVRFEEIEEKMLKGEKTIEGVIAVSFNEVVRGDLDSFLDVISKKLVASSMLGNVQYRLLETRENETAIFQVRGDASEVYDYYKTREKEYETVASQMNVKKRIER